MPEIGQSLSAAQVIELLKLKPHPEGGYFRETYRDPDSREGRASGTAIYFLLSEGEVSRWHRVDAAEIWHWYGGAALELRMAAPGGGAACVALGDNLAKGERPQAVVPKGHWQSARSLGAWTLVGCTVAPGFEFSGFEMAPKGWEPGSGSIIPAR